MASKSATSCVPKHELDTAVWRYLLGDGGEGDCGIGEERENGTRGYMQGSEKGEEEEGDGTTVAIRPEQWPHLHHLSISNHMGA